MINSENYSISNRKIIYTRTLEQDLQELE